MKLIERIDALTVRKRLAVSNVIMFVLPVAVTAVAALVAAALAFWVFSKLYLPRLGLSMRELHDMGEQYEDSLKSFLVFAAALCIVMLALMVAAIVVTNRFLTRFVFRRLEEPLDIISEAVGRVSAGNLETPVVYARNDEFRPVTDALELMRCRLYESAERTATEEQVRRELFAGISHDLRSPLTSVRAYTEALIDGVAKTPEDEEKYLRKIRAHELEIERMTDSLFLYSKMELRDYPVHIKPLDVRAELERIIADNPMEHLCASVQTDGELRIAADPMLFERVAVNLLGNSQKYRRGDTAHVTVTASRTEDGILIAFADDGPGVPSDLLPRLFEPFYRTDPARKHPAGGSGLGLAIVRRAVAHMGGSVWAEDLPDGGLCVKIILKEADRDAENTDN